MSDVRCTYKRVYGETLKNYWQTSCGYSTLTIGKYWIYCPFCSKPILRAL